MLLLVTDTSGRDGSVALAHADEGAMPSGVKVIEEVPLAGGTFSAQLVPQIAALLDKHGYTKAEIGAFVAVSGPGSFTGLRVGLAAIKALAEILQKPILPVSLLEVIAQSVLLGEGGKTTPAARTNTRLAVALDAGRGEVYVGQYEIAVNEKKSKTFRCTGEALLALEALAGLIESGTVHWLATPDVAVLDFLKEKLTSAHANSVLTLDRPNSQKVASAGWQKLQAGESVSPEQLEANYIRQSDAEIFATRDS